MRLCRHGGDGPQSGADHPGGQVIHRSASRAADPFHRGTGLAGTVGRGTIRGRQARGTDQLRLRRHSGQHPVPVCRRRAGGSVAGAVRHTHPEILTDGRQRASAGYASPDGIAGVFERPLPAPPAAAEVISYLDDLRPMRRLVEDYAERNGLSEDRTANLVLAASELAANTLRHTSGGGTLRVWHTRSESSARWRIRAGSPIRWPGADASRGRARARPVAGESGVRPGGAEVRAGRHHHPVAHAPVRDLSWRRAGEGPVV